MLFKSLLNEKKMEFLKSRHSYVTYFQSISKERYTDEKNILGNTTLAIAFPGFPWFSHYFEFPLHQLLITHTKQRHLNNLTYIIQASNSCKLI